MFEMYAEKKSEIFWELCEFAFDKNKHYIALFRSAFIQERAAIYSQKIKCLGSMLTLCVGFIDVTKIQISRPSDNHGIQNVVYSRYKRIQCLLFCTVTTPDGLIFVL